MRVKYHRSFGLLVAAFLLVSCGGGDREDGLFVVATTGMVGDMVRAIAGPEVEVRQLMGPGVDPHSYNPVPKDTTSMARADLIFYSGMMLEGKMESDWESYTSKSVAVTGAVPAGRTKGDGNHPDPHVWGDVELWSSGIDVVVAALTRVDPEGKAGYEQRGEAYREKLEALHRWALERAESVPEERRVMVTSHDAFEYFGDAYGFRVFGLQGISTVGSYGAADRAALAKIIEELEVSTIFVETSVNSAPIESVAQDAGVKVADSPLFSDAMGVPGVMETVNGESYDLGTYEGMIKHNMNTLVEALK